MKTIVYQTSLPISGFDVPKNFKVEEVGVCYLFSDSTTENVLSNYVTLYYERNDVFFIPDVLKDLFIKVFGYVTNNDTPQSPVIKAKDYDDHDLAGNTGMVKEEIAKQLGGNNISPSQITFVETIKEYDMYEELQTLLDGITQDEYNEVDAIFVTLTTDAQDPFLVQSGTQNSNRQVNIKSYGGQIGRFEELRKKMDPTGVGLKGATFHFKKGVTSIARLGEKRPLYVFFVSTSDHALADVDFVKQTYLPEIEKQLKNIKKID
ncbi:MAG: hypothetical protein BWK78_06350 [Thiotrichaceae bacterium IS1]|nr:MAG: hypothetical protein BWK78_06350 [Thiotrichaceae bacterium IS1]